MKRPLPVAADVKRRKPRKFSPFISSHWRLRQVVALSIGLASIAGTALSAAPSPSLDRLIDFQLSRFGVPPPEFDYDGAEPSHTASPPGRPSWRTYVDLTAPSPKMVLIQSSAPARTEGYPIAMLRDVMAEDANLGVSFKLLGGDMARSAGVFWRAQNTNDYYFLLVSALHRELRLRRMKNGRTMEFGKAAATFDETGWNFLEVSARGQRVAVWLNERSVLEVQDTLPPKPGKVGLITEADTVALFDDFYVQNGRERVARKTSPRPGISKARSLHVAGILTTDADFRTPRRSFRPGGQVQWRVQVADEQGNPVPSALVECELVIPSGAVFETDKAMTGTDGASLFNRALAKDAVTGAYSVRVKVITHADTPEATYSSRANLKSEATFEVSW